MSRSASESSSNQPATLAVITVCLNALEDLKVTTESVQGQTAGGIVHVVVDGGSKDGTADWLRTHRELFAAVLSEPDRSIQDGYNKALKLCPDAKWIIFMNAGDTFKDADVVASSLADLQREDVDFIFGAVEIRAAARSSITKLYPPRPHSTDEMPGCHQSCFVRGALMKRLGFDLDYRLAGDFEVWLRAKHTFGCKTGFVDRVIATIAPEGFSARNEPLFQEEYVRAISKYLTRRQAMGWLVKRKLRRAALAVRRYVQKSAP